MDAEPTETGAGEKRRRVLAAIVFVATLSGFAVNGEIPFALPISLLARDHPHPWCYQAILVSLLCPSSLLSLGVS